MTKFWFRLDDEMGARLQKVCEDHNTTVSAWLGSLIEGVFNAQDNIKALAKLDIIPIAFCATCKGTPVFASWQDPKAKECLAAGHWVIPHRQ